MDFNVLITVSKRTAYMPFFGMRLVDYVLAVVKSAEPQKVFIVCKDEKEKTYFEDLEDSTTELVIGSEEAANLKADDTPLLILDGAMGKLTKKGLLAMVKWADESGAKIMNHLKLPVSQESSIANSPKKLAEMIWSIQQDFNNKLMDSGVFIVDIATAYICPLAKIGRNTIIYPNTIIDGACEIGTDCIIGANSHLINMKLGDGVHFKHSVGEKSEVGDFSQIGPFAYLRPNSKIGESCKIG
ncbi:MAG: hypothetical protein FWD01_05295, partial [Defluviitaleaceae bacterium]|nr:hypothetical protein [Defluviitaleaceae bacterium]